MHKSRRLTSTEMAEFSIGNDAVELSIDPKTGAIAQIVNRKTPVNYLKAPSEQTLYLWLLQTGKKSRRYANDDEPTRVLASDSDTLVDIRKTEGSRNSTLEVRHNVESVESVARFRLGQDSNLILGDVRVTNNRHYEFSNDVVAVGFPRIQNVRVGNESSDDVLVRPNRFGEKIPDPAGKAGTYPTSLLYGGFASMMWMDIYDESGGLYLASHDKSLLLTALETVPDSKRGTVALGMRKYAYVPPGSSWTSEPFAIGVHVGDWHWAADRYREWTGSWMTKPNVPDDVKQMDGWYGVNFKPKGPIQHTFMDIERLYDDVQYMGLKHIEFWGQMVGDGCCNRFYYPDPRLGTPDDLKSAILAVKKKGGRIGFYFNIQAFSPYIKESLAKRGIPIPADVKMPEWSEFRKYAQTNFDGSLTVQYPGREFDDDGFRIMCTASKGWQDYLTYWIVERYVKEYGANFAYVDQVFSPTVSYCFNLEHGHQHHGASAQGRVSLVKRISEEGRAHDPSFALCIEGNGDSVGQFSDLHLYTTFSSQTRYPAPEVFAYTFPDYVIIDGFANNPVEWIGKCYYPDMPSDVGLEDLINRVYLLGFRFDVTLADGVRRGEALTEHIRELIKLRKKVKHIQYSSRFLDDIGLRSCPDKVVIKVFRSLDDRRILLNLIDYGGKMRRIRIELDPTELGLEGGLSGIFYATKEHVQVIDPRYERGALVLDLPQFEAKVATVVLERKQ